MQLLTIIQALERLAPPALQENYDNSGLLVGFPEMEIKKALICLDSTPEVVEEAIEKKCNLIIAHHPIIFSGLKKLNGKNYIERAVMMAVKNDIAIYAIHTNLDNVRQGVNSMIAAKLGLHNTRILEPKSEQLTKLVVFVPVDSAENVRQAIFQAGGGHIGNYDCCSFNIEGNGTFRAGEGAKPYSGQVGAIHTEKECRIEVLVPAWLQHAVVRSMIQAHPYEEVAYDLYPLRNTLATAGSGMIGELPEPVETLTFLKEMKQKMNAQMIRHTKPHRPTVSRVAVCGGSGSFLLQAAIKCGADILLTSDFKYHQFFDADGRITIADCGHYESEQFTIPLLSDWLKAELPTFATHFTEVNTNPVNYL